MMTSRRLAVPGANDHDHAYDDDDIDHDDDDDDEIDHDDDDNETSGSGGCQPEDDPINIWPNPPKIFSQRFKS